MSIATTKLDLAKKIIDTNNRDLINHIKAIFDTHPDSDWFEELPDDVKASVKQGIKEAEKCKEMAKEIIWSPRSEATFYRVIELSAS